MTPPLPYGSWPTPITSELVVAAAVRLDDVRPDGRGGVVWGEGRAAEGSGIWDDGGGRKRFPIAFYIGYKRFHGGGRCLFFDFTYGSSPNAGAAVFEFIAVYRSNYSMLHLHQPDGFGYPVGFVEI